MVNNLLTEVVPHQAEKGTPLPLKEGDVRTLGLIVQGLAKRCKDCGHVLKIQNLKDGLCLGCR